MQINRLFEIVYLLIEQKTMTTKQLAEHFQVSPRTILRDIDVLSTAGVPLYTVRGRNGGIALMDGYVLGKAMFSEAEQQSILLALRQLSSARYPETASAISKLKGIFVKQEPDWIEVDFSGWGSRTNDQTVFELLLSSVMAKTAVCFIYANTNGETKPRCVYPLKLIFKSMAWYLSAYCTEKEDYRIFKLTRMTDLTKTEMSFADLSLKAPPPALPENASPPVVVQLRFDAAAAHRVYDEFDKASIVKQPDGSFLVTAEFDDHPWLIHYLLTFGQSIAVLSPPRLRTAMAETAQAILNHHT